MSTALTVAADRREDGTTVVTATGEIDLSNIEVFTRALAEATGDSTGGTGGGTAGDPVTVDLSGVDYLDSVAINALFTYADHIRVVANPTLMSVLTVSGLTELVAVERSDDATRT